MTNLKSSDLGTSHVGFNLEPSLLL